MTFAKTHGRSHARLYGIWTMMRQRCANPKAQGYHRYGGRGIGVCDAWADFLTFAADVGEMPSRMYTLALIDAARDFQPGNVRWMTRAEVIRLRRAERDAMYEKMQQERAAE